MTYTQIGLEVDGPIASIVLSRPEARNAMTEIMGLEVTRAVAELEAKPDVRAVLVRGEGKAFSAGGDLGFLDVRAAETPEHNREAMLRFYGLFLSVRSLRVPTIAVLHGAAMGAGLCFAMACDLRLAAAGATMALNFVRLGLHPGMGATWLLPRLVGPSTAAELLLTGRVLDAERARAIGLVDQVHPPDALLPAARALAGEIARAAPIAVAQTKRSLHESPGRTLEQALAAEADAQAIDYATSDLREGVLAARERREARFSGR